jgi:hypothetical protein
VAENPFDDRQLWDAHAAAVTAGDTDGARALAGQIVGLHLGFFTDYARETGFPQWDTDMRDEYLHELLCVALEKVATYDQARPGNEGRKNAAFITYVKPYLRLVRYRLAGRDEPMRVGHETMRMRFAAQRFISGHLSVHGVHPSNEQIAADLSKTFGKTVGTRRVENLLAPLKAVSGDELVGDDTARWSGMEDTGVDVAEQVIDAMTRAADVGRVRSALGTLGLSELEMMIVTERLMSEEPIHPSFIAVRFGLDDGDVVEAEASLRARLRDLLG